MNNEQNATAHVSPALIDAITQIFAQFELVYHNQYGKAFATADKEKLAKRMWLNHLKAYEPQAILRAADLAIRTSEFLPSIYSVLKYINADLALPTARDAYLECCHAASPKATHAWSHVVVYWTGRACGWNFLASCDERQAFPVFKEKYQELCQRLQQGQTFTLPQLSSSHVQLAQPESVVPQHADAASTLEALKDLFKHT